jgi:predicted site-specific integrase-resolvase
MRGRVSVADAEKTYRVPQATLRRWCAEGRLTSLKRDGRRWLLPIELDQMLDWRQHRAA